jgi:CDP-paratose 2-epimerase
VGIVAWFHLGDQDTVERTLALIDEIGITKLRTGFSWADYERDDVDGRAWMEYVLHEQLEPRIRAGALEVLFNFLYTPWNHARVKRNGQRTTASPPKRLRAYGDFIDAMLLRYGHLIHEVELMNEMDIPAEWDREFDPQWHKLARTLRHAGRVVQRHNRIAVLGGPTRTEPILYERLSGPRLLLRQALRHVDVVGLHGFPGTWDTSVTHASDWRWRGWETEVRLLAETLRRLGYTRPMWVTETGSSAYTDRSGQSQLDAFLRTYDDLREVGVERLYWYGLTDLVEDQHTINHVITGETRESNPHSHYLGMRPPLMDHLRANRERYFAP